MFDYIDKNHAFIYLSKKFFRYIIIKTIRNPLEILLKLDDCRLKDHIDFHGQMVQNIYHLY